MKKFTLQVESSDWWEHVRDFYQNKRDMDILFMKYEDMHADGASGITELDNDIL